LPDISLRRDQSLSNLDHRNTAVDFLKTFAIFGVIIIHTCGDVLTAQLFSFNWLCAVILRSLAAASVPLFFLCSGALLLDPEKELSLHKLYTKNLLRIIIALFFWAVFYKIFDLILADALTYDAVIQAVKEVLLFRHKYHLYFLQIILLVYVFLPITRVFVKHASRREWIYLIAIWGILGIVYPTVKGFWPFELLSGTPQQWMINQAYAAVGYTLLGYYLDRNPIEFRKGAGMSILGFAVVLGGTMFMTARSGTFYTGFLEGMSIGVALMAAGIFSIVKNRASWGRPYGITYLSKASFCIYLIHAAILSALREIGISPDFAPYLISVPLIAALNMALSCAVYFLLSHVPLVRKWLV